MLSDYVPRIHDFLYKSQKEGLGERFRMCSSHYCSKKDRSHVASFSISSIVRGGVPARASTMGMG